jgi:predicted DNA-binding transcriptional regulator AlpA
MTAAEAAGYCRVRLATMYERRPGRPAPPRVKLGNRLRYRRADLDRWMAEQKAQVPA